MKYVTATNGLLSSLREADGVVQVRDDAGQIVGYYVPFCRERAHLYVDLFGQLEPGPEDDDPLADLRADFDLDEIEKLLPSNGDKGLTLAGVYERLVDITPDPEGREYLQKQIDRLKERDRCDTP